VSERTLKTRLDSLVIIQARFDKGTVPELDVYQAQIEVSVAETAIASFQRQIVQTQNALRILLGRNPGPVTRGDALASQTFPPAVPTGLPSELLQRRPDVVQAEANLMAATATVGVAEALRYPSISLTGSFGAESTDLSDLNSGDAETWGFGANLFAPIFNSGQLKAQAEAARERAKQAALVYEGTLQQSFREVEDALVSVRTYNVENQAQARRAFAARNAARLSRARYDGGVVDYLEVLDTERTLFNAELAQSETLQLYYNAIVRLYGALGGGWSIENYPGRALAVRYHQSGSDLLCQFSQQGLFSGYQRSVAVRGQRLLLGELIGGENVLAAAQPPVSHQFRFAVIGAVQLIEANIEDYRGVPKIGGKDVLAFGLRYLYHKLVTYTFIHWLGPQIVPGGAYFSFRRFH
jgi:hypothetical protein